MHWPLVAKATFNLFRNLQTESFSSSERATHVQLVASSVHGAGVAHFGKQKHQEEKKKGLQGGTWKKDGKCPRVKNEPQRGSQLGTDDFHKARSERKTKTKTNKPKRQGDAAKRAFVLAAGVHFQYFFLSLSFPFLRFHRRVCGVCGQELLPHKL